MPAQAPSEQNDSETIEPVRTSVTIVETIQTETPTAVVVQSREDIKALPGINMDDRLLQIPGFSLLRRQSSIAANPTTQGVSLRGVGPTGASRTLVLWDGIPMNDPFGGWLQWARVAPEEVERVELSRSASTSVFGDRAMGGAIALFSRPALPHHLRLGYEGGNKDTHQVHGGYSIVSPRWAATLHSRAFRTDGYLVTPDAFLGPVDEPAASDFVTGYARLDYTAGANRFFTRFDLLGEDRRNGTPLQRNSTTLGNLAGHYSRDFSNDTVSVLAYHTREEYRSTFSAIAANRATENLTTYQSVPATSSGGAALWSMSRGPVNATFGGDARQVEGFSNEHVFATGLDRSLGGELVQGGVFGQTDIRLGGVKLYLGAREHFASSDRRFFSPSGGASWGHGPFRIRGSAYRSFRLPTLNELYRGFRVGNVQTNPNDQLQAETLSGGEVGANYYGETVRVSISAYRYSLGDLITNVTISSAPNLILRRRQNADSGDSQGIEFDASKNWRNWILSLGYLYVDSQFQSGLVVPQVAKHQGSGSLAYRRNGTFAALSVRSYSSQFEDDLNKFLLPGYASVQLMLSQQIHSHLSAHVAIENLLDREYYSGFTPVPRTGTPFLWRLGLRWDGPIR